LLQALYRPASAAAATEAHRHAYNAAFQELDLPWHWDERTFAGLQPQGRAGVRSWLERQQPHLMRGSALDFLVDTIEDAKACCQARTALAMAATAPRIPA
jgi:hypothetical protein